MNEKQLQLRLEEIQFCLSQIGSYKIKAENLIKGLTGKTNWELNRSKKKSK